MRFYLDLYDDETQQWRDACKWYKENPNAPPQRFQLIQKTRERIVQIGNQLGIDVYPGTPPIPPPDPPPSGDLCAACVGTVHRLPIPWGQFLPVHTVEVSGFACEDYWVFEVTVPADAVNGALDGRFVVAEFAGPTTLRQISISNSPCDFRALDQTGANGPFMLSNGTSATVWFNVGPVHALNGGAELIPGRTYYVNVRNWSIDNGGPTCLAGSQTNAIVQPEWPR